MNTQTQPPGGEKTAQALIEEGERLLKALRPQILHVERGDEGAPWLKTEGGNFVARYVMGKEAELHCWLHNNAARIFALLRQHQQLEKALRNAQDALTYVSTAGTLTYAKQIARETRAENEAALTELPETNANP